MPEVRDPREVERAPLDEPAETEAQPHATEAEAEGRELLDASA